MRRKQLLADNECINEALQQRGADQDKEMSISCMDDSKCVANAAESFSLVCRWRSNEQNNYSSFDCSHCPELAICPPTHRHTSCPALSDYLHRLCPQISRAPLPMDLCMTDHCGRWFRSLLGFLAFGDNLMFMFKFTIVKSWMESLEQAAMIYSFCLTNHFQLIS